MTESTLSGIVYLRIQNRTINEGMFFTLITTSLIVIFLWDLFPGFSLLFYSSAMLIAFVSGYIIDRYGVSARYMYIFQFFAALTVILAGVKINQISFAGIYTFDNSFLSAALTVAWIMVFMNALSLADGVKGLSAAICLCASIFIIIIANVTGNDLIMILTCIFSGSLAGVYIFSRPPFSVANLAGFVFATIPLLGIKKDIFATMFLVPLVMLVFPVIGYVAAYMKNNRSNAGYISFEKKLLHTRLMRIGLSEAGTMYLMYLITAVLGTMSLLMYEIKNEYSWFIFIVMGLFLFLFFYVLRAGEDIRLEQVESALSREREFGKRRFLRFKTDSALTIIGNSGLSRDVQAFDYTPFGIGFYSPEKCAPGELYDALYAIEGRDEPISMKLETVRFAKRTDEQEGFIIGAVILEIADQDRRDFIVENYFDILIARNGNRTLLGPDTDSEELAV